MKCETCKKIYASDVCYCGNCGAKLSVVKTKVYVNIGKSGISSISYVLPGGLTINTKGNITMNLANGISYTKKI